LTIFNLFILVVGAGILSWAAFVLSFTNDFSVIKKFTASFLLLGVRIMLFGFIGILCSAGGSKVGLQLLASLSAVMVLSELGLAIHDVVNVEKYTLKALTENALTDNPDNKLETKTSNEEMNQRPNPQQSFWRCCKTQLQMPYQNPYDGLHYHDYSYIAMPRSCCSTEISVDENSCGRREPRSKQRSLKTSLVGKVKEHNKNCKEVVEPTFGAFAMMIKAGLMMFMTAAYVMVGFLARTLLHHDKNNLIVNEDKTCKTCGLVNMREVLI
jgi:hypothetical protein